MYELNDIKNGLTKKDSISQKLIYLENIQREIKGLCWNIEKNMRPKPSDVGDFIPDFYSNICNYVMYETKDTEFMQFIPTKTEDERTKYLQDYKYEIKELEKYEAILTFIYTERKWLTNQLKKYGDVVINNSKDVVTSLNKTPPNTHKNYTQYCTVIINLAKVNAELEQQEIAKKLRMSESTFSRLYKNPDFIFLLYKRINEEIKKMRIGDPKHTRLTQYSEYTIAPIFNKLYKSENNHNKKVNSYNDEINFTKDEIENDENY